EPESSRKAEQYRNVGRDHCGSQGTHLIARYLDNTIGDRTFVVNINQSIIDILYVLRSVWRFFSRTERDIGKQGELGRKGCLEEQHRLLYRGHAGFDVWVRLYERRYA